jgi:D-glycero-alpha-D-manno-heptose-7-phosphate kinase
MIITRSPLRISLGGGGTDLPSYSEQFGGSVIAAAIDRYVYITVHRSFDEEIFLKYSRLERVQKPDDVEHPIVRECLRKTGVGAPIEISSMADIPAGTGLGSSGSFTTGLLRALYAHQNLTIAPSELAEQACEIEIDRLSEPVGKQDQYIAAYGGLRSFVFGTNGSVETARLAISDDALAALEDNLVLFFTGYSRSASTVLSDQDARSRDGDQAMLDNLHLVKDLGEQSRRALESDDLDGFAHLMNVHWQHKRERSTGVSNDAIDGWYRLALENGARAGKLVGAGGGGFLMLYADDKIALRRSMREAGLTEVRFHFDFEGTKVIIQ